MVLPNDGAVVAFRRVVVSARVPTGLRGVLDAVQTVSDGAIRFVGPDAPADVRLVAGGRGREAGAVRWDPRPGPDDRRSERSIRGSCPHALTQALLDASRGELEALLEAHSGPACCVSPSGEVRLANAEFMRFLGVSRRRVSELNLLGAGRSGSPWSAAREVFQRLLQEDPCTVPFAGRFRDPRGVTRAVRWRATALGPPGARTAMFVLGEEVPLSDADRASLHTALDAAGIGTYDWSTDGRSAYVDDNAMALLGVERFDDATIAAFIHMLHPDDRDRVGAHVIDALVEGRPYIDRFRLLHPTRGVRWLEAVGSRSDRDGIPHLSGTLRDVTDDAQGVAEEEARGRILTAILAQAPVAVFAFDAQGSFVYARGALLGSLGVDGERVIGRSVYRMFRGLPTSLRYIDVAASGRTARYRYFVRGHWVDVALVPSANGSVIGVAMDVSGHVRLEEEALRGKRHEAPYLLLAGLAHDFNNLLSVILTYTDVIGHAIGPPDSQAARDLQRVRASAVQASDLVRRLMNLGQDPDVLPAPLDLTSALSLMFDPFQRLLGSTALTFQLSPVPRACVARTEIEHIGYNLLINARDATVRGGSVSVTTGAQILDEPEAASLGLRPGAYASLSVADTGPGFPPHLLPVLFAGGWSTKGPQAGSGLGLATVHAIARRRGGTARAENLPGGGARVTVLFPSADLTAATGQVALVVDPDPAVGDAVGAVLQRTFGVRSMYFADMAGALREPGPFVAVVVACRNGELASVWPVAGRWAAPVVALTTVEIAACPAEVLTVQAPFSASALSQALEAAGLRPGGAPDPA